MFIVDDDMITSGDGLDDVLDIDGDVSAQFPVKVPA